MCACVRVSTCSRACFSCAAQCLPSPGRGRPREPGTACQFWCSGRAGTEEAEFCLPWKQRQETVNPAAQGRGLLHPVIHSESPGRSLFLILGSGLFEVGVCCAAGVRKAECGAQEWAEAGSRGHCWVGGLRAAGIRSHIPAQLRGFQ